MSSIVLKPAREDSPSWEDIMATMTMIQSTRMPALLG